MMLLSLWSGYNCCSFIARLYRALLVAQTCLASVEISPEDAEQIWHRRGNDCEIMRIRLKNGEGK